jgi:hypothetical protein
MTEYIKLSKNCSIYQSANLVCDSHGARNGIKKEIFINYTERSSDQWHSDTEIEVEITEVHARKLIAVLLDTFPLIGTLKQ